MDSLSNDTPTLQRFRSAFARPQTQGTHDALKIVTAIIFNLDSAALFAVTDRHMCAELLLQSVL